MNNIYFLPLRQKTLLVRTRADGRSNSQERNHKTTALRLWCGGMFIVAFLITSFPSSAFALTVSPAKVEITAEPGQTTYGEIELFNEQAEPKTFFSSYENFESRGDSGAPHFIGARDGLATWISMAPQITIGSGERVKIPYTITIPADAKPGGYFAAIFFGSQPPVIEGGGEVAIGGKIGVLVLLRVSGDIAESAGLVDFGVKNEQRFFTMLPVVFEYGFNNTGGDRVVPKGEIKIKNTLQLTSATLLANDREGSVLPQSTRRFEVVWGEPTESAEARPGFFAAIGEQLKNFHVGWYVARLNLSWGESNQRASASYHFFVIPWQLLSILLGLGLILWFISRTMLMKYKRRIIAETLRKNE